MPEILMTPEVTAAWNDIFVPKLRQDAKPEDKPKFSIVTLFTQEAMDSAETKAILAAMQACAVAKWGTEAFARLVKDGIFENPFRRDIDSKGYPERFVRYLNSSANEGYPPTILARDGTKITDKQEIYAGVRLRISLSPRAYGGPGTKYKAGVTLDLRNVQKLGDAERIPLGGATGGKEFGALPAEAGAMSGPPLADLLS